MIIFLLVIIVIFVFILFLRERFFVDNLKKDLLRQKENFQDEIKKQRKEAVDSSRAVVKGQISEQLSPFLPGFNYKPSDCLFIGKPFDFLCIKGISDGNIEEIIFIDIKTGKSNLNKNQRMLRDVIEKGKIKFEKITLDIP